MALRNFISFVALSNSLIPLLSLFVFILPFGDLGKVHFVGVCGTRLMSDVSSVDSHVCCLTTGDWNELQGRSLSSHLKVFIDTCPKLVLGCEVARYPVFPILVTKPPSPLPGFWELITS